MNKAQRMLHNKKIMNMATLHTYGIEFESKYDGKFLLIGDFVFFPETGLYKNKDETIVGTGVDKLLEHIGYKAVDTNEGPGEEDGPWAEGWESRRSKEEIAV